MGWLGKLFGRGKKAPQNKQDRHIAQSPSARMRSSTEHAISKRSSPKPGSSQALDPAFKIPPYRKDLLFISDGEPPISTALISFTMKADGSLEQSTADPSTIYTRLPISSQRPSDMVPKMGYFPTYARMTPEQRWIYLAWLRDVTAPIDIGYVFVYYYGLERHLIYGDFEAAVAETLLLRKHHDQGSFNTYSSAALVHGCLMRKRADVLMQLYREHNLDYFENSSLLLLHTQGLDLTPDMLMRLSLMIQIQGVSKKYIKDNFDLFFESISTVLLQEIGRDAYPFSHKYDLSKVKGIGYAIFANISLPPEVRTPSLPNLLHHKPFVDELGDFFRKVHEETKRKKSVARKTARISPP